MIMDIRGRTHLLQIWSYCDWYNSTQQWSRGLVTWAVGVASEQVVLKWGQSGLMSDHQPIFKLSMQNAGDSFADYKRVM